MKTTRFFAIIACAAAVAASCMKDDLKDMAYAEPIFSAVREDFGNPALKTMLTDNYKVVWCSGDEVGVFFSKRAEFFMDNNEYQGYAGGVLKKED